MVRKQIAGFDIFRCPVCKHDKFQWLLFDDIWSLIKCEYCHNIITEQDSIPLRLLIEIFFDSNKNKYYAKDIAEIFKSTEKNTAKVLLKLFRENKIKREKKFNTFLYYKK